MARVIIVITIAGLLAAGGCFGGKPGEATKNQPSDIAGQNTLYHRLGGQPVIAAISDKLIDEVLQDPRVNFERTGQQHVWSATPANVDRLKMYWAQFLGMLCDGPQVYEGKNLLDVHRGMGISESEWYAFMDDLKKTLDSFQIPTALEQDVMSRVASTHQVVVGQ